MALSSSAPNSSLTSCSWRASASTASSPATKAMSASACSPYSPGVGRPDFISCDATHLRIAIVGTHCCGKSTLVADFLAAHRDYVHEPEPYEWLQETESFADSPTAEDFYRQLEFSVERLRGYGRGARVIIERSPLDFVAYLRAIDAIDFVDRAIELSIDGIRHLDLIVFLPLNDRDGIIAPESEDREL